MSSRQLAVLGRGKPLYAIGIPPRHPTEPQPWTNLEYLFPSSNTEHQSRLTSSNHPSHLALSGPGDRTRVSPLF